MRRFILMAVLSFATTGLFGGSKALAKNLLNESGWHSSVKKRLERVIKDQANRGRIVVFDFDNTLVCRDIGEATFAQLVADGRLSAKTVPQDITPSFSLAGKRVGLGVVDNRSYDLTNYYEDLLGATRHQEGEHAPFASGYAWVVQIMGGMTPKEVVDATKKAYQSGVAFTKDHRKAEQTKIKTPASTYRRPYFYPEMVELVATFLSHGYEVYVLSASNVWTVRYMVTEVLNKKIAALGVKKSIAAENVIGVATLMQDKQGKLYKDPLLVRQDAMYAALDDERLSQFRLTTQIVYPLTGYYGKVANIEKFIGKRPYFVAGDSPNDHAMLGHAEHQLWLARLEKPSYQVRTAEWVKEKQLKKSWIVQPVLYKSNSGFIANVTTAMLDQSNEQVRASHVTLKAADLL